MNRLLGFCVIALALASSLFAKTPVILDTDAYNEIDDPFAVAYVLRSRDVFDVRGITAAPYRGGDHVVDSPAEGVALCHKEILNIKRIMGVTDVPAYMGAPRFMTDTETPVRSDASAAIVAEANRCAAKGERLTVIAIGALTNVASALLTDPKLAEKMDLVWLGGHLDNASEFNLNGDRYAAKVVFDSDVPFTQIPCFGVVDKHYVPCQWLIDNLKGCGAIGEHLTSLVKWANMDRRIIWDITAVGVFMTPRAYTFETCGRPTIYIDKDEYGPARPGTKMRRAVEIDKKPLYDDLFGRLSEVYNKQTKLF